MAFSGADINGVGLIALLLLSIGIPTTVGMPPKGFIRYLAGLIVGVLLLFGLITTQIDPTAPTQPYMQIAVLTFTVTVVFISLPRFLLQVVMAMVLIPAGLFLCDQYHTLVSTEQFTGDQETVWAANVQSEAILLEGVRSSLKGKESKKAGFLLETPLGKSLPEKLQGDLKNAVRLEPRAEWHTPLTGIYENWVKPIGLYYPGQGEGGSAALVFSALDSKVERVPDFRSHRRRGPLLSTKSNYERSGSN